MPTCRIWSGVPRCSFRASTLTYSYRVSAVQENVPVPRGGNIGERMKGFSYRVSAMEFLALGFGGGGERPIRATADGHLQPASSQGIHGKATDRDSDSNTAFQKKHAHHTLSP